MSTQVVSEIDVARYRDTVHQMATSIRSHSSAKLAYMTYCMVEKTIKCAYVDSQVQALSPLGQDTISEIDLDY